MDQQQKVSRSKMVKITSKGNFARPIDNKIGAFDHKRINRDYLRR